MKTVLLISLTVISLNCLAQTENSFGVPYKLEEQKAFWSGRLGSYYLMSKNNSNARLVNDFAVCLEEFFSKYSLEDFKNWDNKNYNSEYLIKNLKGLSDILAKCYQKLNVNSKYITIEEASMMVMELFTKDYSKMDSIAKTKMFTWDNSMRAYFSESGQEMIMFSFSEKKISVFIVLADITGLNYYRKSLLTNGFKLGSTQKTEDGYSEVYPIKSGGSWLAHVDEKNKKYGVQLVSPEFTNDFMNLADNERLMKK